MKRRTIIISAVVVAVLGLGTMAATGRFGGKKKEGPKAVAVVRGSLVDKALAVGTIEPRIEVSVKSILAGVVRRRFAAVGDFVKRGQPLLEISPNPTPLEMVELRRSVELREIELKNVERELTRQQELRNKNLISPADLETAQRQVDEARSQLSLAQEGWPYRKGARCWPTASRWRPWSAPPSTVTSSRTRSRSATPWCRSRRTRQAPC